MELDALVEKIVAEVVKRIEREKQGIEIETKPPKKKGLVILNGGNKNLDYILVELNRIQKEYEIKVYLTEGALEVIGKEKLEEFQLVESKGEAMSALTSADIVILPTLTRNTCAKVAIGIGDTLASYLIGKSLLLKKDVVALYDSCIVEGKTEYEKMLLSNISRLQSYGIKFLYSKELSGYVLSGRSSEISLIDRNIISMDDIRYVKDSRILLKKGVVITPLVREKARENNIELKILD